MKDWPQVVTAKYRRAVFLDRDGTINVDTHYPHRVEELELIPEAIEGLRILAQLPLHILVVSNQGGIALGYFTREQMSQFNVEIRHRVAQAQGRIDAFYYCPYLEPKNLPTGVTANECSKPSPGMLREGAKDFGIDLSRSFMVGDTTSDIVAGQKVGSVTILVKTGKAGKEEDAIPVTPTWVVDNLYEAALVIRSSIEKDALEAG